LDGSRFDALTRTLVTTGSRRRFLAGVIASAGALVGVVSVEGRRCSEGGTICREDANCCAGLCGPKDQFGRRRCGCTDGQTDCNGQCVNLQSDDNNCGACGAACPDGTICEIGCVPAPVEGTWSSWTPDPCGPCPAIQTRICFPGPNNEPCPPGPTERQCVCAP
jgi:hypothetical protein